MALKTNVHGLLAVAQHVGPKMTERGEGVIVVTGATASLRGEEKKHVGLDLMMLSQRCCKIMIFDQKINSLILIFSRS